MKKLLLILCLLNSAVLLAQSVQTGAEQFSIYIPILQDKRVGVVANHTSIIGDKHLVDLLLEYKINVVRIFAPEHGFRGTADAGEHVNASKDPQTGLEIVSLYGKNYKPTAEQLRDIECVVFDMQDVGTRFYTYLSTMHYVMEACAENDIPFILLDRPNPNGFYVDGPILENSFSSFVGLHPIPIVHGMTLGELAFMINSEGWLSNDLGCDLTVISCSGYSHKLSYQLPVPPSPNLPNQQSIYLYPSLCLFEGTVISLGRGTDFPFQVFGHPALKANYDFSFTPQSVSGAKNPPLKGELCYGVDLRNFSEKELTTSENIRLEWLLEAYQNFPQKEKFFNSFFYKLCGTESLRKQIEKGLSAEEIRASWQPALTEFKQLRKFYLLYEDFE